MTQWLHPLDPVSSHPDEYASRSQSSTESCQLVYGQRSSGRASLHFPSLIIKKQKNHLKHCIGFNIYVYGKSIYGHWVLHLLVWNTLCAFNFSHLCFLQWCYLHPTTTLPSCPGLGPAQVPYFWFLWWGFWGVYEAEILIKISALAGIWTSDLGQSLARNRVQLLKYTQSRLNNFCCLPAPLGQYGCNF